MKQVRHLLLLSLIFFSCQKELSNENFGPTGPSSLVPTLTTTAVTSVTNSTAASGGNISSDGGATVTARGVCWGTASSPTIAGNHTTDGTGTGAFTSSVTALTANTVYYIRAYASNSAGTAYGNEISFTSTNTTTALPTVTTASVSAITTFTATGGGIVTADGGAPITVRGTCWSTSPNPVATGNHTTDGAGIGTFSGFINGLTAGTTYHVRAYATNSVGTAYGGDSVFTTTSLPSSADVYVAGYESNGTVTVAKLWKNGSATSLTDGTKNAEANSVFVNGTDVYVAGWEMLGSKKVAKYWKNSVAVNLTNGTNNAEATLIIVAGTDIYVSGYEAGVSSITQAKYWKNGTAVNLAANATEISTAKSIAVSGTDVYVAVSVHDPFPAPSALIIKNGIVTDLSAGFIASASNAVFIQGSDIYVAGRHGFYKATYWKNNLVTNLPSTETNTETAAFGLCISGTDIYVCGFEKTSLSFGNIEVAKYWKNGVATNLTNEVFHASADAITVAGSDVYAAGYEENAAGNGVAKYWKNGTAVSLTNGSNDAGAYAIVVK